MRYQENFKELKTLLGLVVLFGTGYTIGNGQQFFKDKEGYEPLNVVVGDVNNDSLDDVVIQTRDQTRNQKYFLFYGQEDGSYINQQVVLEKEEETEREQRVVKQKQAEKELDLGAKTLLHQHKRDKIK